MDEIANGTAVFVVTQAATHDFNAILECIAVHLANGPFVKILTIRFLMALITFPAGPSWLRLHAYHSDLR